MLLPCRFAGKSTNAVWFVHYFNARIKKGGVRSDSCLFFNVVTAFSLPVLCLQLSADEEKGVFFSVFFAFRKDYFVLSARIRTCRVFVRTW